MSKITKQNIGDDQVADEKIRLDNNAYLRGRNAADSADINVVKVNTSNTPEFGVLPQFGGSPLATQSYVGSNSGETNTASNLGTGSDGQGVFNTKVGVDLQFKRIKAGSNITVTSETNDLLVASSAEAN